MRMQAKALLELKQSNIIHCDIKPANTVLHQPVAARFPVVKLIDFGEANTVGEAQGDIAGTPGYMAPEMESDGDATFASDMCVTVAPQMQHCSFGGRRCSRLLNGAGIVDSMRRVWALLCFILEATCQVANRKLVLVPASVAS